MLDEWWYVCVLIVIHTLSSKVPVLVCITLFERYCTVLNLVQIFEYDHTMYSIVSWVFDDEYLLNLVLSVFFKMKTLLYYIVPTVVYDGEHDEWMILL